MIRLEREISEEELTKLKIMKRVNSVLTNDFYIYKSSPWVDDTKEEKGFGKVYQLIFIM